MRIKLEIQAGSTQRRSASLATSRRTDDARPRVAHCVKEKALSLNLGISLASLHPYSLSPNSDDITDGATQRSQVRTRLILLFTCLSTQTDCMGTVP